MPTDSLTINEIKEAFFSLKLNKSQGYDVISFNVIKKTIIAGSSLTICINCSANVSVFVKRVEVVEKN